MPRDPDVDAFVEELAHPLAAAIDSVRDIVLGVDPRIVETIKWKSPTFVFEGNIASIEPRSKKTGQRALPSRREAARPAPAAGGRRGNGSLLAIRGRGRRRPQACGLEKAIRAWIALKEGEVS
jgi:hypothetical protein